MPSSTNVAQAERLRHDIAGATHRTHKSQMGQFMTPARTAVFMASLFERRGGPFRVLDPGAGLGALCGALTDRWRTGTLGEGRLIVDAYELDDHLRPHLQQALKQTRGIRADVHGVDFLDAAANLIEAGRTPFTHVVLNPPYKKMGAQSSSRLNARRAGLETVNLYSAFVGLALALLQPGGQLVAIVPRSFCNGSYYRPFRQFILQRAAVRRLHLFGSRSQAFRDDDVLQENIIIVLERGAQQQEVVVSCSEDDSFAGIKTQRLDFSSIVQPGDAECFIRIPSQESVDPLDSPHISHTLEALGVQASTGPVVDFRLKVHLQAQPVPDSVPLLYPAHFSGGRLRWPLADSKKANAIDRNESTERWLYPAGIYTVVRRFSSKEESRRLVASLVTPDLLQGAERIGFENHLNVLHHRKQGLNASLAMGLCAYLNCAAVDAHFRRFSGHTQVNATDLKALRYPSRHALETLGDWVEHHHPDVAQIEQAVLAHIATGMLPG